MYKIKHRCYNLLYCTRVSLNVLIVCFYLYYYYYISLHTTLSLSCVTLHPDLHLDLCDVHCLSCRNLELADL